MPFTLSSASFQSFRSARSHHEGSPAAPGHSGSLPPAYSGVFTLEQGVEEGAEPWESHDAGLNFNSVKWTIRTTIFNGRGPLSSVERDKKDVTFKVTQVEGTLHTLQRN